MSLAPTKNNIIVMVIVIVIAMVIVIDVFLSPTFTSKC